MNLFRRILVPIDGSFDSHYCLQYAADIAKKYKAEVTLIYVLENPVDAYSLTGQMGSPANFLVDLEGPGKNYS